MFRRLCVPVLLLLVIVAVTSTPVARAQNASASVATGGGADAPAWTRSIRVSDEELVGLVSEGIKKSSTLRVLADRLTKSDVVVYVRPDVSTTGGSQGRLGFISATAGVRYLSIHVPTSPSRQQQMAILGHLLQSTVEIADAPAVVDAQSLKREFERIGYVQQSSVRGVSFDSPAAGNIRRRILQEVGGS